MNSFLWKEESSSGMTWWKMHCRVLHRLYYICVAVVSLCSSRGCLAMLLRLALNLWPHAFAGIMWHCRHALPVLMVSADRLS